MPCHGKDMESAAVLDPGLETVQGCPGTLYMQGVCVSAIGSTHMYQN